MEHRVNLQQHLVNWLRFRLDEEQARLSVMKDPEVVERVEGAERMNREDVNLIAELEIKGISLMENGEYSVAGEIIKNEQLSDILKEQDRLKERVEIGEEITIEEAVDISTNIGISAEQERKECSRLDQLTDENQRLKERVEEYRRELIHAKDLSDTLQRRNEMCIELQNEVEQLRKQLEAVKRERDAWRKKSREHFREVSVGVVELHKTEGKNTQLKAELEQVKTELDFYKKGGK